jgi:polyisoprenoid-binding protein YceI
MRNRPWPKWVLIGAAVVVILVVAVPFVYINFIRKDAPPKLSLSDVPTATTQPSANTTADPPGDSSIDGTYTISSGSQAGYRAKEVLFGQSATAAGRTSDVTGEAVIAGTTVSKADFTVGLATVKSDEDRRDQQFQGRIMDVADFPTATFTLTQPIQLTSIPAQNEEIKVSATGDLTLRGVTKSVTFELSASRKGSDTIAVQGDIPITWSDWGIPEPSFGPAQVASDGEIEFLLVLTR